MKYDVAYAGIGLAFLFMTVLGFDNITVGGYSMVQLRVYTHGSASSYLGLVVKLINHVLQNIDVQFNTCVKV